MRIGNFQSTNKPISLNSVAQKIKKQIQEGQYVEATDSWSELESVIARFSNNVVYFCPIMDM